MYFSSFGSKDLFLEKVVEVINSSSAKIKKYLKEIVQDKSRYILDENLEDIIIDCEIEKESHNSKPQQLASIYKRTL